MIKSLAVLFLVFLCLSLKAQQTNGDLALPGEPGTSSSPLRQKLNIKEHDSTQVDILLRLAHYYWHRRKKTEMELDSCHFFARAAEQISKEINYREGHNQASFILCKIFLENNDFDQAKTLVSGAWGEQKVRLLLIIGEQYVFNYDPSSVEYKKATQLVSEGLQIAKAAKSKNWQAACSLLLAKLRFRQGNLAEGKKEMMTVIDLYHRQQDYENEATYWSRLGNNMPDTDNSFADIIKSHEMAVANYLKAGNKKQAAYSLRDLAIARGNHGQVKQAGKDLNQMLKIFNEIGESISSTSYYMLGDYYRFIGSYDKALYYALQSVKVAQEKSGKLAAPYSLLGRIYQLLGTYQKSIKYYQLALDIELSTQNPGKYATAFLLANSKAEGGRAKEALIFLNAFVKDNPVLTINDKELISSSYGNIYNKLGDFNKAEQYYLEMLELDKKVGKDLGGTLGSKLTLMGSGANFLIGQFYAERGNYLKAKDYLKKSLINPQFFDKKQEVDTYRLMFKADSALGNFAESVKNLQRYHASLDSINAIKKSQLISELDVRYETSQRMKDIKILQEQQKLQQTELKRSAFERKMMLWSGLLLVLIALATYFAYSTKRKSNQRLRLQQEEINRQNLRLEQLLLDKDGLISEKDELLHEKDWLLKEVHHRVKNNLQIIMSLLRTQSAFLKNQDARNAIEESENRVQAISLIHQKLYNSDQLARISMPGYIADLINYLEDGLHTRKMNIIFKQKVDHIHLDLAQAVPVGLILNESITNAIKYAFDEEGGLISVSLEDVKNGSAVLSISDNGRGLPDHFNAGKITSLGMQMMKGLCGQLKGDFRLDSANGLTIRISFKLLPTLSPKNS